MNSFQVSFAAVVTALALAASGMASAAVVLSTNFNARTVGGATASSLNWTANGVAAPASLTAVAGPVIAGTPPAMALFTTTAANGRFAVNRNIRLESSWYLDIPLNILAGNDIQLTTISLDAFIFNDSGSLQGVNRDLDLRLALLNSSMATLDFELVSNVYPQNQSAAPVGRAVEFNLTGNTLSAGGSYYLRLTASNDATYGNNAGIDNLFVNGNLTQARAEIPEPGSLALIGIALAGLGVTRSRKTR